MSQFNWDDDDQFRDIPDEVSGTDSPASFVTEPVEESDEYDEYVPPEGLSDQDDSPEYEEAEEDYSAVLSDARLRLEQGRLYEMIMKHDLFGGVDADERATKHVQNQIRKFAKEQMEIMLGMRQTVSSVHQDALGVDLPFNSLEVEALRALASAATKGATKDPDVERYVAPVERKRSGGLNQIGGQSAPRSSRPVTRKDNRKPLPERASTPVKRVKVDPNLEAELRSKGIEKEYIEEAKRQLSQEQYRPLNKDVSQMTKDELSRRNAEIARRTKTQVRSSGAMPMATPAQAEMIAAQSVADAPTNSGLATILGAINKASRR